MTARLVFSLVALLASGGCSHDPRAAGSRLDGATSPVRIEAGDAGTPVEAPDAGSALASSQPLVSLPVPGFGDATVSLPLGTRRRRPILLAVHGNYDTPDFQCATWRRIVRDRGFVLCPRGVPRRDSPGPNDIRYTFEGKLVAELDAAIATLHEHCGAWIDRVR